MTGLSSIDVLFEEGTSPVSEDCDGGVSSVDGLESAYLNELSEELIFERDETDDLEFDSEPDGAAPKGVRARTGRRLGADKCLYSADVGL